MNPQYSYEDAGLDGFLSRSIDDVSQINLDSQGPNTTAIRYDSAQVSGALGDTLRLGRINLNGASGNIVLDDGNTNRVLLGEDDF